MNRFPKTTRQHPEVTYKGHILIADRHHETSTHGIWQGSLGVRADAWTEIAVIPLE